MFSQSDAVHDNENVVFSQSGVRPSPPQRIGAVKMLCFHNRMELTAMQMLYFHSRGRARLRPELKTPPGTSHGGVQKTCLALGYYSIMQFPAYSETHTVEEAQGWSQASSQAASAS